MSDDQIVMLYRGLTGVLDFGELGGLRHHEVVGGMLDQLRAGLGGLTSRDPERMRNLVEQCRQSEHTADQELASDVVPTLVHYDYAFTRDTLISLWFDGAEFASEGAYLKIPDLMRDELTPDQIADFNMYIQARGWDPVEPSRPEG